MSVHYILAASSQAGVIEAVSQARATAVRESTRYTVVLPSRVATSAFVERAVRQCGAQVLSVPGVGITEHDLIGFVSIRDNENVIVPAILGRSLPNKWDESYDKTIAAEFPDYDGLISTAGDIVAIGRQRWVNNCRCVFSPGYWYRRPAALETVHNATARRRTIVVSEAFPDVPTDTRAQDAELFAARTAAPQKPPSLSLLVCHLPERAKLFAPLLAELVRQIGVCNRGDVELFVDSGFGTTGEKRNRLLSRANGNYIAFIDDDDWVVSDYCLRILRAFHSDPEADCLPLRGVMTRNGANPKPFEHDLKHTEWWQDERAYYRPPNHLNPVRRSLAVAAGFPDITRGEDREYSMRLLPMLKKQGRLSLEPLYWYWARSEAKQ